MRVDANAVQCSWTLLAAFGASYAPGYIHVQSIVGSSPTRGSSFFLGKVTALVCCVALPCLFV